ncbi:MULTISPECIES: hypothetical protein [Chryseobacterium]|uniref:Bacteriocin n=1 Tax=Chryseobacterium camelliae TaxID=1265445 RepID=A0ABU0TNM2_9FLAO|nr:MULTISPECIES: hypothetical protein [Chryseobacterium]MDT3407510.1 hypothetical protein [Pseudacidovorax intermedius]MDQ1098637.1 hypothetical protein [Chryseobacterium camelliae]MDQ1102561.1 hypothetical protein [Chryseobacterium sp. SORGH_AS_1048]MDR6085995.1 hypothetical protein [Chryseobacterium sp. SORGH_AS_0909]MDR6130362.1 hypothetical protein [Chryseobacterium sp. SORGH_AS_1175]
MNRKNQVLKNAQKLDRTHQKSILGGVAAAPGRRCCEYDDATGQCTVWTCTKCYCP